MAQRRELQIHLAVIEHLKRRGVKGLVYCHVPNGGKRGIREAVTLKRMGVRAGVPDLLLWHNGESFALELKAPKGRTSSSQDEFISRLSAAGVFTFVAKGLDAALMALKSWGLIK